VLQPVIYKDLDDNMLETDNEDSEEEKIFNDHDDFKQSSSNKVSSNPLAALL